MHTSQSCRYLRETPGEHTTSQRRTEFSRRKLSEIRMFLNYKDKARGDIFEEKCISKKYCQNKESANDPTESNSINQLNTKSC